MLQTVLNEFDRYVICYICMGPLMVILHNLCRKFLVIDCRELHKAASDSQLIGALARQVGYWPVFIFLNSMNNLIDLASVGLIGQKSACIVYPTLQLDNQVVLLFQPASTVPSRNSCSKF